MTKREYERMKVGEVFYSCYYNKLKKEIKADRDTVFEPYYFNSYIKYCFKDRKEAIKSLYKSNLEANLKYLKHKENELSCLNNEIKDIDSKIMSLYSKLNKLESK